MKKVFTIILSLVFLAGLFSCGPLQTNLSAVQVSTSVGAHQLGRSPSSSRSQTEKDQVNFIYSYPELWLTDPPVMTAGADPQQASYDDILANHVQYHQIEEFKIASDIYLLSSEQSSVTLAYWGGDVEAEPFVDLMQGDIDNTVNAEDAGLEAGVYETVWFQLNGDDDSIKPVGLPALSLNASIPVSGLVSTINIYFSSFVEAPFIAYILSSELEDELSGTPDQETFDAIKNQDYSGTEMQNIGGGAPGFFLPLIEAIDLTSLTGDSSLSFRIEGYFDDLLAEYYFESSDATAFYYLSPFQTYTDNEGNTLYGPLPFSLTYTIEEFISKKGCLNETAPDSVA